MIEYFAHSSDLSFFFANLLASIVVALLAIGVAFSGRRSSTQLAQAAAFGYACYRGPKALISSTVNGWFSDIGSIASLLVSVALLIVGIAGLRLTLRGDVLRYRPPMAPDPHR